MWNRNSGFDRLCVHRENDLASAKVARPSSDVCRVEVRMQLDPELRS